MRRFASIILRLVFIVFIGAAGFLLFESPATINVQNVPKVARSVIKKNVDKSGDTNLRGTLKLAKDFGVENKVLEQLPSKYHRDLSYVDLYNLSVSYQENGELTAKNLKLPEKNEVQKAVNYLILQRVNKGLSDNSKQVNNSINIFHYFLFGAILILALAALLVLFGQSWASIALLIAAVGSFGALQYYLNQLVQYLQSELDPGISLITSSMLWLGLAISVVVAIIWPLGLKLTKKKD